MGRVSLPSRRTALASAAAAVARTHNNMTPASADFASTGSALRHAERVAACAAMGEPALLVGETGAGKTTLVQRVASAVGARVVALNLSQQTDAADLIGGFKPGEGGGGVGGSCGGHGSEGVTAVCVCARGSVCCKTQHLSCPALSSHAHNNIVVILYHVIIVIKYYWYYSKTHSLSSPPSQWMPKRRSGRCFPDSQTLCGGRGPKGTTSSCCTEWPR